MKELVKHLVVLLLILVATQIVLAGGGNRVGGGGASELLIPVGTRDIGMGGSSIANTYGVEALFWNPAGISRAANGANVFFSHMAYIADIGVEYGAASIDFEGLGTLGVSIKSLSIGDLPVTTVDYPDGTGQTFTPQFFVVGLTYAKRLSDRIAVGLTANFVAERMSQVSANGVAFNVGVMYENLANLNGLSLGVVVNNIGPQMTFSGPGLNQQATVANQLRGTQFYVVQAAAFDLPSTIQIGLAYHVAMSGENNGLLISTSFQNNNYSDDEYKVGAEYAFNNLFFLRGGWAFSPTAGTDPATGDNNYIFGPTAGAGIQINSEDTNIAFDYAFRSAKYFSGTHVVSLRLGF